MSFRRAVPVVFALLLVAPVTAAPLPAAETLPVTGQFVDDQGRPLAGARVELAPAPDRSTLGRWRVGLEPEPPPLVRGETAADGSFAVTAPTAGHWRLRLTAAEGWRREDTLPVVAPVELGPLVAYRGLQRELEVVDAGGRPVAGARVFVLAGSGEGEPALTDSAGRTRLEVPLGGGGGELLVVPPGGAAVAASLRGAASRVTLPAPADPPEAPITVLDGADRPVPEAVFWLWGQPVDATDAQGKGRLPHGPSRIANGLEIVAAGRLSARFEDGGAPPRLQPPVRLVGRVRTAAGTPLAGALVWASGHPGEFTTTGPEGAFTLLASAPARKTLELIAAAAGFVPARLEVPAAGPASEFRLIPAAQVAGQVVDGEGRPQAGFLVSAEADPASADLVPPPRFRTGADGRFVLAGLVPGVAYQLRALRPEVARGELAVAALAAAESRTGLRLPVTPFRIAEGRVLDAGGEPVAGAVAMLSRVDEVPRFFGSSLPEEPLAPRRGESDASGRFRIAGLEPGRYDLRVRASGFAAVTVRGLLIPAKGAAVNLGTVHLSAAAVLRGRVVDADEAPVAETEIAFLENQGAVLDLLTDGTSNLVVTDSDGRFRLTDLTPGGTVSLTVSHPGFVRLELPGVRVPRDDELVIPLVAAGRIAGRVTDAEGRGIEGAQVATPDSRWEAATTDANGAFTLEGLSPGTVQLLANAQGYLDPPAKTVEIVSGQPVPEVLFQLERGAVVSGRVTAPDGSPLPDAHVFLRESTGFGTEFARTDEEGRYRLEGVPPGERRFTAGAQGLLEVIRTTTVRAGENRLDFRLERGLAIRGRVVGPEGQTVDQGEVAATEEPEGASQERAAIAPDGTFEIANLEPGTYRLRADSLHFAPAELPAPVHLGPGSLEGVVLTLRRGAKLVGTVTGLDFDDLTELQVVATSLDGSQYSPGQLDFRGGFVVDNVTPGAWTVIGSVRNRQAMKRVDVEAGAAETPVEIVFGGGFTLSGRVTRGGRPVVNAGVLVSTPEELAGGFATTDHDGRFEVPDLAAGEYQLAVATNWNGFAHTETVALDGNREIAIEIVGLTVSGRVTDSDGAPLPNVRVNLRGSEGGSPLGDWGSEQRSDEAGVFRFSDVAPGSYHLQGQKEGFAQGEVAVEVQDADTQAELRLAPAPGLVLEVRTARGPLPNGAAVAVAAVDGQGRVVFRGGGEADERGRVRLASLPLGHWTLWLSSHGYALTRLTISHPGPAVPVTLGPGAEVQIEVPALRDSTEGARVSLVGGDGQALPSLHQGLELAYDRPLFFGQATLDEVPPGRWTVRVVTATGTTLEKGVELAAGTVRVVLE